MFKVKMMPGQALYTEDELKQLESMIDGASKDDPGEAGEVEGLSALARMAGQPIKAQLRRETMYQRRDRIDNEDDVAIARAIADGWKFVGKTNNLTHPLLGKKTESQLIEQYRVGT